MERIWGFCTKEDLKIRIEQAEVLQIKESILSELDMSRELEDEEVYDAILQKCGRIAKEKMLSLSEQESIQQYLFHALRKLDVLQDLVEDKEITEIMVNGPEYIFYEKKGKIYRSDKVFSSKEKLDDVIQQIVGMNNRMINEASPIVDTRLLDGSRVNIVLAPISIDGAAISIRKFPEHPFSLEELIQLEALSDEVAEFLKLLVVAKYNIFVSGGTGSGKTTFLNALSQYIPDDERIITIEDSAELQLIGKENLIRLETRNANTTGVVPITIRDLIRSSLRMRPDRIVVGECRGEEALDVLQAMNTGHDGSLSTGHANSCRDMVARLETMVLMGVDLPLPAIRSQIASGIDIFVHLGRLRDNSRKVLVVAEVLGVENGEVVVQELFRFKELTCNDSGKICGKLEKVTDLQHIEKLQQAGLWRCEP